jgi:hypothetical protein
MTFMTLGRMAMAAVLGLGFTLTACGRDDDADPMDDTHGEMPAGQPVEGMSGMQHHAHELDAMTPALQQHIQQMRQLTPEQQHERMGEHVTRVSQMLSLMSRQMREMDMGMGMSDEQMGRMMGMSGVEHRRMMDELQGIRSEVEELQTASVAEVRQRMGAHLERLEGMVAMMERSAEHMRRL